jgi:hypothetical protein
MSFAKKTKNITKQNNKKKTIAIEKNLKFPGFKM